MKRRPLLIGGLLAASLVRAQETGSRWRGEIDALLRAERRTPSALGGVLFVGSSTVRRWQGLETTFAPDVPVVLRRGLGGSRLNEWPELVPLLVLPAQPRLLVVYAGENDIDEGALPMEVLASFIRLVQAVRGGLPDTRIAFVSIKPSPLRAAQMEAMREANRLVQTWVLAQDGLDYVDLHAAMLDPDGRPRPELYVRDQLHLSAEGYALWRQVISAHLRP